MNKVFFILALFTLATQGAVQENNLIGSVGDYGLASQTNVAAKLTLLYPNPRVVNNVFVRPEPIVAYSNPSGVFGFTNIQWGRYRLEIGGGTFPITVLENTTGEVQLSTLYQSSALPPNPASSYYNITQSESVFYPRALADTTFYSKAGLLAGSNTTFRVEGGATYVDASITNAAAGGTGDATLAGDNTWTGSNVFNGSVVANNMHVAGGSITLSGGDGANQWSITNVSNAVDEGLNFIGEAGASVARFIWNNNFPGIWAHNFYGLNSGLTNASGQTISQEIAAAGGSGDATLAGDNTWTGTNTFNNGLWIGGEEAYITDDGSYYAAGLVEVAGSIRTSTGFYGPLLTNEGNALLVNGVPFVNGGMDASNILTGTLDAARLPVVWTNAVAADGVQIEGVGVTNGYIKADRVGVGIIPTMSLEVSGNSTLRGNVTVVAGDLQVGSSRKLAFSNGANYTNTLSFANETFVFNDSIASSGTISGDGAGVTNIPQSNVVGLAGALDYLSNSVSIGASDAITNNHASAVTFSNDVTVASNLVVQGSSTFEALNVGDLNVTNLAASIIDSTNIINGTISSNDIAAGTIGTNLLSQAAYDALSDTAEYWSTNVSAVTSNGLYAAVPKLATANAFANSNYFGSNVVISGGSTAGELATIVAKFTGNGAGLSNVYGAFIKTSPMPTAAQIGTNGIALWNSNSVLYAVHVNGDGQYSLTNQISPAP